MKNFLKDKIEYNHHSNLQLFSLIFENEKRYHGMAEKLFNHNINAQHVWNKRIFGAETELGIWEISNLKKLEEINEENYQESLQIVSYLSLDNPISYINSKAEAYTNTIGEILYHIINHSSYHRGQIVTALKAEGAIPVATDYIFYKRKKA